MTEGDGNPVTVTPVSPYFKWILIAVMGIFVLAMIAYGALAMTVASPTDTQTHVFDVLDFTVKSTLGAFLGLIGAKVT